MILPNFPISEAAYNLAWRNRKPEETLPHCIARAVSIAFSPKPVVPFRPLLDWVEVVDSVEVPN